MTTRPRTTISTDKFPTVQEPPTRIVGDEMKLDPAKVIKAWLESAEVLKTVALAAKEAQDDNEFTRGVLAHNQRNMFRMGVAISVLQCVSVAVMWYLR